MTTPLRTAPRLAAFSFAAFMTLATLLGVGQLAQHSTEDAQIALSTTSLGQA